MNHSLYSARLFKDGSLAVGTNPNTTPTSWQVWQLRQDGSRARQVPTPSEASCQLVTWYMQPMALPDGRLGLTRSCNSQDVSVDTVVAYDPQSLSSTTVADLRGKMHVGGVSWNPDLTRGVASQSSQICANVAWVTASGPQGIPVAISEGGRGWRLDRWLAQPRSASCTDEGRADCPAWSPDGSQVALFASPESIGVEGQRRLDVPWSIYLIDVATLRPTRVLGNLYDVCDLAWSPDGRWLAFVGKVGNQRGIWLFSPTTRRLHLVASYGSDTRNPVWSPDGRRLAVIENLSPLGEWPSRTRLAITDVSAATART